MLVAFFKEEGRVARLPVRNSTHACAFCTQMANAMKQKAQGGEFEPCDFEEHSNSVSSISSAFALEISAAKVEMKEL